MKKIVLRNDIRTLEFYGVVFALFLATTVSAQVAPTVSVVIKNQSNATTTEALIGTVVRGNAEVASSTGATPLGTVDFNLYQNSTCSSTSTVESNVLLASGLADSATTTVGATGLSYRVHYDGQLGVYTETDSSCVSVTAKSNTVGINSALSSTSVLVGTSVFQSSNLTSGTANATGTVAYKYYTNNACSLGEQNAGVKTVTNAVVPNSDSIQMNTVGTLYFKAVYSGDLNNNSASGLCQSISILATSTPVTPPPPPPPTPIPGQGSISGNSFNDLNKSLSKDSGENGIGGFTINLYGGTFWWNWGRMSPIKTTTTDASGNYSFPSLADGFYQIEEVKLSGWKQLSSDFRWVLVLNGQSLQNLNFANISISSSTNQNRATSTKALERIEKKIEKEKKKQEKREERIIKKQNKLLERIQKLQSRFTGNSNDDDD
ncbi:MAG: SdrD B-like domain-containing protein [Minisyncoccia bacterium]